jgi:hypothetical protein
VRLLAASLIAGDEKADMSAYVADYERFIRSDVQPIAIAGLDSMRIFGKPDQGRLLSAALSRSEDPDGAVRNFALLAASQRREDIPSDQWPRVLRVLETSSAAGDVERAAGIALVMDPAATQCIQPLLDILSGTRALTADGYGLPNSTRAAVLVVLSQMRNRLSDTNIARVESAVKKIEDTELSTLEEVDAQRFGRAIGEWRATSPRHRE